MRPPRPPLAWVVLVLTALTAACGSTVPPGGAGTSSDGGSAAGTGPAELGVPPMTEGGGAVVSGPSDASDDGSAGAAPAGVEPGRPDGNGPAAAPGGADPAGGRGVAPQAAPRAGAPGVTPTTIRFGAFYSTDTGEANAALGAEDLDQGDARRYYDAVVKSVNAAGGIAGRRLVPSYFEVRATSADSAATTEQAACEKWTRDDPAFVVFGGASEILRTCAERSGMLNLHSGASNAIGATYRRYPHYLDVGGISLDRAARVTTEGLARTDYFSGKPVIGVVAWDDPNYRASVEQSLVPALRRLGFVPKATAYVKVAEDNAGLGESGAAASNAVLRFRSEGVTHVLIVDGPAGGFVGTGLTLLFVKSAGSQSYYPRYGLNDSNSPEAGRQAGLWTADDMRGARAVSWNNILEESDKGTRPNAPRKACLDLMQRNGIQTSNVNARQTALRACDFIWLLRTTLGAARTEVNRSAVLRAVEALGTKHASTTLYGTRFSPQQHDAVGKVRLMKLDDGCGCFAYTSGPYDVG